MQRIIFEFQRTCDNNLSLETFRQKVNGQLQTLARQKLTLDSLLGFENTKVIQENKKRDEMRVKRQQQEVQKKLEAEKLLLKEERAKKKKAEAAAAAAAIRESTSSASLVNPTAAVSTQAAPLAVATPPPPPPQPAIDLLPKDDLLVSGPTAPVKPPTENLSTDNQDLDISQTNPSVLAAIDSPPVDPSLPDASKQPPSTSTTTTTTTITSSNSSSDSSAIMSNAHYTVFAAFNKLAGEEMISIPDTFLPDEQMKLQRQKTMRQVVEIDGAYIEYLESEVASVKSTFQLFRDLVDAIERLEAVAIRSEKKEQLTCEEILAFIKDYLKVNQIAEEFLASGEESVRISPFFEDFMSRITRYVEQLTEMLKQVFAAFAVFDKTMTLNFPHLADLMKKFSQLNLQAILSEIHQDISKKIITYMLGGDTAMMLFETTEEDGKAIVVNTTTAHRVRVFTKEQDDDSGCGVKKISRSSSLEEVKDYIDISLNNAVKYFEVVMAIASVITTVPVETKLEECQDFLEMQMERVMKNAPEIFQSPAVLDQLSRFDAAMNAKHDIFCFDMKGIAENLLTTSLEEKLKMSLLSLKNQMVSQMQALKESDDEDDYMVLKDLIVHHFGKVRDMTAEIEGVGSGGGGGSLRIGGGGSKKANSTTTSSRQKSCLEVVVLNYQLFATLLELFESELERKTKAHYDCLTELLTKVIAHYHTFLDTLQILALKDSQLMKKALATFTDIQLLSISLSDALYAF